MDSGLLKSEEKLWRRAWFSLPVLFLLTQFLLAPMLFRDPRFWAEEGTFYYPAALGAGFFEHLFTYVLNGNYQFLVNAMTALAARVDPAYAPSVTSFLSVAVFAGVVLQFGLFLRAKNVSAGCAALAMLAWTAAPTIVEIFASATNIQWVVALSVLILCLSGLKNLSMPQMMALSIWVAMCGLTGVPSVLLAPFFLLQAILGRSKNHLILGAVLCLCGAVQAGVILEHGINNRELVIGPRITIAPMLLQSIFTPLLGVRYTDLIASIIRGPNGNVALLVLSLLSGVFIWFLLAANRYSKQAMLVVGIWAAISIIQTIGAIGHREDKIAMISALGGARYFATGYLAIVSLITLATSKEYKSAMYSMLMLIFAQGIHSSTIEYTKLFSMMPSWSEEVAKCHRPCDVAIWPVPWKANLPEIPSTANAYGNQ